MPCYAMLCCTIMYYNILDYTILYYAAMLYYTTILYIYIYIYIKCVSRSARMGKRGGRVLLTETLLPRIARLATNCSTGNNLSKFKKRTNSKSSN